MHMIIGIIVHERDQEEAFKKGKEALHELVKRGHFDWYMTFDTDGKDYKGRWYRLPAVVLISDPKAIKFIEDRWQATLKVFMEAYESIKLAIQYLTPEEIMEETAPENLSEDIKSKIAPLSTRVFFYYIGNTEGGYPNFLYFEHEPIIKKSELEYYRTPEKDGLKAYVVPAHVHW